MLEPRANVIGATVLGTAPNFSEVETVLLLMLHGATPFLTAPLSIANRYRDVVAPSEKWCQLCFKAVSWCGESGIGPRPAPASPISRWPPGTTAAHVTAMRGRRCRPDLPRERLHEIGNRPAQLVISEIEKSLDHSTTMQCECQLG
jgi:hypothetical protein